MSITRNAALSGAVLLGLIGASASAQTVSTDDYRRADSFLANNTMPLVDHSVQRVTWIDDGHFWFRDHDKDGDQFMKVDAATGEATRAFDRDKVAAALAAATGKKVDASKLPVTGFVISRDDRLEITSHSKQHVCDKDVGKCELAAGKKDANGKA